VHSPLFAFGTKEPEPVVPVIEWRLILLFFGYRNLQNFAFLAASGFFSSAFFSDA
jgi:hypothetical protein